MVKEPPYDAERLSSMDGLAPVKKRGVTVVGELPLAAQKIESCFAMISADPGLWYIQLVSADGDHMLVYRDPHP